MRNTIILILIAIALGAYVYFYEIEGEQERTADKERAEQLINLEKDSIQSIIINDFEKVFQFSKTLDGWKILKPVETDAEESTVNSFLTSLTAAKKSRTFAVKESDKAGYGLQNPQVRIFVSDNKGISDSIGLGDKTSIGSNMYASKGDSNVFISPISLKNAAQKTLFSWRDKRAVKFEKDAVRAFSLKSPSGEFKFEKEGANWKITKPLDAKAEDSEVTAVINKLDFGRIKTVESEDASNLLKFNLTNPAYVIELFSGSEMAKSEVIFSKVDDNKAYGKDGVRPHIFTVDSNFISPFNKSLFNFRDKDLVDFNKSAINHINLLNSGTLYMFNKDTSERWSITTGEPIKNYKIVDLVSEVERMKVDRFVSEKPTYLSTYGLANPRGKLELFAGDSKEIELEFGDTKNEQTFIRNPRTGQVVAVNNTKLEKVLITLDDIFDDVSAKKETEAEVTE